MANTKSAAKRARQNIKRRLRNRDVRSTYRTALKQFSALIESGKIDEAKAALPALHKNIDTASTKGVITKENASRKKSRVTLMLNKAAA